MRGPTVPARHEAGTTFRASVAPVRALAPEWSATLLLRGPSVITIEGMASGMSHLFEAQAAETAEWAPGAYDWQIRARRGGDAHVVMRGRMDVRPDLSQAGAGHDPRSHAERVLDAIQAVIEGRASIDQESYTIGGRSLSRTPLRELLALRTQYAAEVRAEAAGDGPLARQGRRHLIRFV